MKTIEFHKLPTETQAVLTCMTAQQAFQTTTPDHPLYETNTIPLIWGKPGTGKSTFTLRLAEHANRQYITIVGTRLDRTLIFGSYAVNREEETIKFFPRENIKPLFETNPIVLIDEITATPESVRGALLELTVSRRWEGRKINPNTIIIGASNPVKSSHYGKDLSRPETTRFVHIFLGEKYNRFIKDHMGKGFPVPDPIFDDTSILHNTQKYAYEWGNIIRHFTRTTNILENDEFPANDYTEANPRSLSMLQATCAAAEAVIGGFDNNYTRAANDELVRTIALGAIGNTAGAMFLKLLSQLDLPEIERFLREASNYYQEVIKRFSQLKSEDQDTLFLFVENLIDDLERIPPGVEEKDIARYNISRANEFSRFIDLLSALGTKHVELAYDACRRLVTKFPIGRTPEVQTMIEKINRLVSGNTQLREILEAIC